MKGMKPPGERVCPFGTDDLVKNPRLKMSVGQQVDTRCSERTPILKREVSFNFEPLVDEGAEVKIIWATHVSSYSAFNID